MRVQEILDWLDYNQKEYQYTGDPFTEVSGFSSLKNYRRNTLTWIKKQKSIDEYDNGADIKLAVVQCGVKMENMNAIISENSKGIFFELIENFWGNYECVESIGEGTYLSATVSLGENVHIGCNCTLKGDITIGDGTTIGDNVVIVNHVVIGKNCHIQSLSVIGEDGFGYYENERNIKTMIKHHGGVLVGDDVFIGTHVNIARGTIDDTIIESGVKIAPSTHIGHNNYVGKNTVVICSRLFGSVEVGENAYIVSSTIRNQCKVGDSSLIGMGSIVTKDVEAGKVAIGTPAKIIRDNK